MSRRGPWLPRGPALCGLGVFLTLAASTCAGPGPPGTSEPAGRAGSVATILVENEGRFTMAIDTDASRMRLGTVPPDGTECLVLRVPGIQRLTATPSGDVDEAVVSPFFDPANARGWRWQVGSAPAAGGPGLAPDDPCEP